jgi:hypothetical protein
VLTGNGLNNIVRGLGGNDRAFGQSAVQFQRLINPVTNPLDTGELGYLPLTRTATPNMSPSTTSTSSPWKAISSGDSVMRPKACIPVCHDSMASAVRF